MTNNEILQANLLDILFDGRNKEYGAYAIRRGYNHRMLVSLGLGLSVLFLLFFINTRTTGKTSNPDDLPKTVVQISQVDLSPDKKPVEALPAKPVKTVDPVQTIKNTTPLIVDDDVIEHTEVPDVATIADNISSTANSEGKPSDGTMIATPPATGDGGTALTVVDDPPPLPSSLPEFPGGFKALQEYLSRNLVTPDDLETGEKKIVRARFLVDKDGSVSSVEINVSGGNRFDKEVIRVCKRMPRWKPAIQNGVAVAMSYILPVTFIGVEQ